MKAVDGKPDSLEVNGYFDRHGRCIPNSLSAPVYKKSRRYFLCEQPRIDYHTILDNTNQHLNCGRPIISLEEFEERSKAILGKLALDQLTENIGRGVHIPFVLPQREYPDIGYALDSIFIPAVDRSFRGKFPDYSFTDHNPQKLSGNVEVEINSRHNVLIEQNANRTIVGIFFPCVSEYSIPAAIEQLQDLPKEFLLAGGFDTCAAFVACPDLLLRLTGYPPLVWMTGLKSTRDGFGYHFEAYGYNLTFNRRAHHGQVAEYWSSGVVVVD